jgi:hypothetical protein
MFDNVVKNRFGLHELKDKPGEQELEHYYKH